jgi:polyisoprenyl-teichoic acid--peptidoglycan teichoic acid transferase
MSKKRRWMLAVAIVVLLVLGAVGTWAYRVNEQLGEARKTGNESRFTHLISPVNKPPEWEGTERVNVLLMGGDERGLRKGEVARSDSMLVASFDPQSKKVHLFSLLRDTYVDIPGHRPNRVNAAITIGGPPLAMETVGKIMGLNIQYYVYVDFQGFIKLVDAIGGVDFYVEKNMHYSDAGDKHKYDIHLKKGFQHLNGDKALQYVRFRHDRLSDFTRTERQRAFLKAVADKLKSGWNIVRLPDIMGEVTPYLETNMSSRDMLKLARLGYKSHQAGSVQVPPMALIKSVNVDGASMLGIRDDEALKGYVQAELAKDATEASPSASPTQANRKKNKT